MLASAMSAADDMEDEEEDAEEDAAEAFNARPAANALWVDKYRPTKFIELLSDERTNRDVSHWIKRFVLFFVSPSVAYD